METLEADQGRVKNWHVKLWSCEVRKVENIINISCRLTYEHAPKLSNHVHRSAKWTSLSLDHTLLFFSYPCTLFKIHLIIRPAIRSFRPPPTSLFGSRVRSRTAATLTRLPSTDKSFEEEAIPDYDASHFCQVSPGDTVGDGQYSIISKLGWGRTCTLWLAKDLRR